MKIFKNLLHFIIYSIISYVLLLPLTFYLNLLIPMIGVALLSGFFLELLNNIRKQLIDINNKSI